MIQGLNDLIKQILFSQISSNNLGKDICNFAYLFFYFMISPIHFGYLVLNYSYIST